MRFGAFNHDPSDSINIGRGTVPGGGGGVDPPMRLAITLSAIGFGLVVLIALAGLRPLVFSVSF